MSPSASLTSPRLMPTRRKIRGPEGRAAAMAESFAWNRMAQRTASPVLPNSARKPSPVTLHHPAAKAGDRWAYNLRHRGHEPLVRGVLIGMHLARVIGHIGEHDRHQPARHRDRAAFPGWLLAGRRNPAYHGDQPLLSTPWFPSPAAHGSMLLARRTSRNADRGQGSPA